jgi:hypothetical protein
MELLTWIRGNSAGPSISPGVAALGFWADASIEKESRLMKKSLCAKIHIAAFLVV